MASLTDASTAGGSPAAANTTAPMAAGPGFPREPPSKKIETSRAVGRVAARGAVTVEERHGTRMQPQLSQYATVPSGAFLIRSTSVEGMVR